MGRRGLRRGLGKGDWGGAREVLRRGWGGVGEGVEEGLQRGFTERV